MSETRSRPPSTLPRSIKMFAPSRRCNRSICISPSESSKLIQTVKRKSGLKYAILVLCSKLPESVPEEDADASVKSETISDISSTVFLRFRESRRMTDPITTDNCPSLYC